MDKLTKYRTLTMNLLNDYATLANRRSQTDLKMHVIFDQAHERYMIFRTGWWNEERVHTAMLYIRLDGGKIWIEEDMTEEGIATYFLEQGVPPDDIVLGFQPPQMQPYTEFAVA